MRILIESPQEKRISLRLPGGMVLSPVWSGAVSASLKEYGVQLPRGQVSKLLRAAGRYCRSHPDWVLVEVESADGTYVKITL